MLQSGRDMVVWSKTSKHTPFHFHHFNSHIYKNETPRLLSNYEKKYLTIESGIDFVSHWSCMGPLELLEECFRAEESDTKPEIFYGKVPKISRKSKHLYSSSKTSSSSTPKLVAILAVIILKLC